MELLAAKCPNCRGDLQLPDDKKQVKCKYCGFDIVVREAVDKAQTNVDNLLKLASSAQETGNYQEGYDYFTKILEFDSDNYLAIWGKGICAARLSTPERFRFEELKTGIVSAVNLAPDDKKEELKAKAFKELNAVNLKYEQSNIITNKQRLEVFEIIHGYDPTNEDLLATIIFKLSSSRFEREKYLTKLEAISPERAELIRKICETADNKWREENKLDKSQIKFEMAIDKIGEISGIVIAVIIVLFIVLMCGMCGATSC